MGMKEMLGISTKEFDESPKVQVSAEALRQLLAAIEGPPHHFRELMAIRSLGGSPINYLISEYNAECKRINAANTEKKTDEESTTKG